ncbi:hypothetical protein [Cupriavidus sp. YAF13]|uniref:hypothetical protein n=1 Tax=Cupriavidus sp. YAF13 TaxID=3233075 RepID=UPI003F90BBC6
MNARLFNVCLLLGWLLVLAGGCLLNAGAGLIFAGLLMLALVLIVARMAGIYVSAKPDDKDAD